MIILISILFSALSLAQATDVSRLLYQLQSLQTPPNQCLEVTDQQDLLQQCARELCGPPEKLVHGTLMDGNFEQYIKPDALENFAELEAPIKDIVKHAVEKNKLRIQALKKQIDDNKIHFEFEAWEPYDFENLTYQVYERHLDYEGKTEGKIEDRLVIHPIYPEGASETFKKGLDAYRKAKFKKIISDPKEAIYSGLYTHKEALELAQTKLKETLNKLKQAKKTHPELKTLRNKTKVISASIDGVSDTWEIPNILFEIDNLSREMEKIITGNYPPYENHLSCGEPACQEGIKEYLLHLNPEKLITDLEMANDPAKMTSKYLSYCKSELASLNLEDSDQEAFLKIAPEVMKRVLEKATKGYSEHSKQALAKHFEEIHLNFKEIKTNTAEGFVQSIKNEHDSIKNNPPSIYSEHPKNLIGDILRLKNYLGEVDPLTDLTICQSQLQSIIGDAFYPIGEAGLQEDYQADKHNIHVSKFSCSHHNIGKQVFAHELGHALSYAFKEQKLSEGSFKTFKELRACASAKYTTPSPRAPNPLLVFEGDTFRTEEDTADLISYMAYDDDSYLYECSLLELSDDGKSYNDLSLINKIEIDTHSSGILRVLNQVVNKRLPMPESCQKVIDASPEIRLKTCF